MTPDQPNPATGLRDYHDVPFPEGTQPAREREAELAAERERFMQAYRDATDAALAKMKQ
jgi:hypothetical protein